MGVLPDTTDLSHLTVRGWRVHTSRSAPDWIVSIDREPHQDGDPAADIMHGDLAVAERMALHAAVVADGHDPVRLLGEVYGVLEPGDLRSRVLRCLLHQPVSQEQAA